MAEHGGHSSDPFDPAHLIGHVKDADHIEVPLTLTSKQKIALPQLPTEMRPSIAVHSGNPIVDELIEPLDFTFTKFMAIELVVAVIVSVVFIRMAQLTSSGAPPQGWFWNLLETILLFLRDQVARPAIGDYEHHGHGHADHGHDDKHAEHGHDHAHGDHGHDDHHGHEAAARAPHSADKFLPYLWTMFFFVLGCNLLGLLPWAGSPTGAMAVTGTFAIATFVVVAVSGMFRFGPIGFWLNQVPSMDLPLILAILLKPMIFVIEILGLLIKHFVLAVRLFANVLAGHLVLVVLLTFIVAAARHSDGAFYAVTPASILGATALSMLELFVAFLQAYIFTFLSALFIGMAVHEH